MLDPELLEQITVRRAELDELEEQLAKRWRRYGPSGASSPPSPPCGRPPVPSTSAYTGNPVAGAPRGSGHTSTGVDAVRPAPTPAGPPLASLRY